MKKNRAMTLMEIIIVVIIVGILATMGVVNYRGTVIGAYQREAQSNLRLISAAEEAYFLENNVYVNCELPVTLTVNCNDVLHLNLPVGRWEYQVKNADNTTFTALSLPVSAQIAGPNAYYMMHGDPDPVVCPDAGCP